MSIHATTLRLPAHYQYVNMGRQLGEDPAATRLRERLDLTNFLSQNRTSPEQTLIATRFTVLDEEEQIELVVQRLDEFSNRTKEDFVRLIIDMQFIDEELKLLKEIMKPTTTLKIMAPNKLDSHIEQESLVKKMQPLPLKQDSQVSELSAWHLACQTAALLFSAVVWLCKGFASVCVSFWQLLR